MPPLAAPELWGGKAGENPSMMKHVFDRQLMVGSWPGYLHQLMSGAGWTAIFAWPLVRQPTLIIAGRDDPFLAVGKRQDHESTIAQPNAAHPRRRPRRAECQGRRTGARGRSVPHAEVAAVPRRAREPESTNE
jgi:hypothetical protein